MLFLWKSNRWIWWSIGTKCPIFKLLLGNISLKINSITSCDAFESQLEIMHGFWYYVKTIQGSCMTIVIS